MARGMWRWWEERNGADIWWARVELTPGQWSDLSQADYAAAQYQPTFWDLPLQEDHVQDVMTDPIVEAERRVRVEVEAPLLIASIGVACVLFVVVVIGYVFVAWLER